LLIHKCGACFLEGGAADVRYYRSDVKISAVNLILKSKPVNWILCTSATANNDCFNVNAYTGAPKIHCEYLKLKINLN